jgi:type IV pilus assembly protein PilB
VYELLTTVADMPPLPPNSIDHDQQAVVWLEDVLTHACAEAASDIHLEPFEAVLRVRLRIDGQLRERPPPRADLKDRIVSRIKVLSRMDISEKRLPQDGRLRITVNSTPIDLRVSCLPTLHGEKLVLRVQYAPEQQLSLGDLGYETSQLKLLQSALEQPNGLILITGPTGSGKTMTLYSCLNHLNSSLINISTVEDPCEIVLPGINQINVNDKSGLGFAPSLRALLRQDPDVLMVGEIRDSETADVAVKAAQTGHLVLSTLHTNDAPSALIRLQHLGLANFNIASSVVLVCAQRLVRKLCPHCKIQPTHEQRFKAVGCPRCNNGYKGRTGIHQVLPFTPTLQTMLMDGVDVLRIADYALQTGVLTLRQAGLCKAQTGITSHEEVWAATTT